MSIKGKGLLFLLVLLVASAAGFWFGKRNAAWNGTASTSPARKETVLYTCGMHPQVIQDHPGNCPICGMRLTKIQRPLGEAKGAPGAGGERKIKYWRAPMDPTYISDKPGKSPMGMDLVPVYEDEGAQDSGLIAIDPVTIQDMGIRTGEVTRGPLRRVIRTVGIVSYNESGLADVTTKFKGWIEKLYVDTTGQEVHKGEPLFDIYSPELYSAEVEYLLSRPSAGQPTEPGADSLRAAARQKLTYYDISDEQIAELDNTGRPSKTLKVLAPINGFVTEKNVVEGQMVDAGMKIYRVANLGLVWIQGEIYEQDLPYIKLGQEADVTLSYLPDRKFRGRVTYIYPYLDEKTRTVHVRMEFHNPGYFLKPGMFASVEIRAQLSSSALLVPESAVLRSGQRNTVFVALDGGRFDPRTVVLGPRAEHDRYEVLSGLAAGERVVTSGEFMLDSESQLHEAIQKMTEPGETPFAPPAGGPTNAPQQQLVSARTGLVYVCPMPEHVSIEYEHPGKCPICGMTLVPVTKAALERMRPGGRVLYYTCPMPEDADVRESKPGKCPKCGMTLIPVMSGPAEPSHQGASEPQGVGTSSAAPAVSALPSKTQALPVLYTCPMPEHANVVSDKPGKCPECGMNLVPTSTVAHGKIAEASWRKEHPSGE